MALMIERVAARRGDAMALLDEAGQCGWLELNARVNRLVRVLRAAGLACGDVIALFAGNSRAVFEMMIAAHHTGVVYVPVNWHVTADELAHVLRDSGAQGLFTDSQYAATAAQALRQVPAAATRLRVSAALPGAGVGSATGGTPEAAVFQDFEALIASQPDDSEPPDQLAGGPMFYTSGTTGRPKGVVRGTGEAMPMSTVVSMAQGITSSLQLPPDGTTLLAGPYYHSAQYAYAFQPMLSGLSVVMTRRHWC